MLLPQPKYHSGDRSADSFVVMLMQVECNRHHPMAVPVHNQDAIQLAIVLPLNNHFYGAVRAAQKATAPEQASGWGLTLPQGVTHPTLQLEALSTHLALFTVVRTPTCQ